MNPAITPLAARLMSAAIDDGSTLHGYETSPNAHSTSTQWVLRARNAKGWRVIVRTVSFERYHAHIMYWLELRERQLDRKRLTRVYGSAA